MKNLNSVAIGEAELFSLTPSDVNPSIYEVEIKVMYTGLNDNGSFMDKETTEKMAKTLRGSPIVGYYNKDNKDFGEHYNELCIDDDGFISFERGTVPYGFVGLEAPVWFQKFREKNRKGETVEREYLMTKGYMWKGELPDGASVIGKPQSMELDENSVKGQWAAAENSNRKIFIITDASFARLCILGSDVEPCFEGSGFDKTKTNFSFKQAEIKEKTLEQIMSWKDELIYALKNGGIMEDLEKKENQVIEEPNADIYKKEEEEKKQDEEATPPEEKEEKGEEKEEEKQDKEEKAGEEDEKEEDKKSYSFEEYSALENAIAALNSENEQLKNSLNELNEKYSLANSNAATLEAKVNSLTEENSILKAFKVAVENKQKDELINKFTMLSEEEKAEVVANKHSYSLEEIENKLSVIWCRAQRAAQNDEENKENNKFHFSAFLGGIEHSAIEAPDWITLLDKK